MVTAPFPVQKAALAASAGHRGFAYFMEQGLGKTFTIFLDFLEKVATREATRLVVVCPNSFKSGWVEDAEKHGVDLDFYAWDSGNIGYLRTWMRKEFKKPPCLIVNWEAIRPTKKKRPGKKTELVNNDLMNAILGFMDARPSMIVFDESIKAKDHDSGQALGGMILTEPSEYQRILSGKPIAQGPHDLWAQMRLIKQMRNRNFYAFRNAFCRMGGFKGKQVVGVQNEDILAEIINPHVFRATKKEWTDLPPKLYTTREYSLTPEMKSMYNQMENDFMLWLNSDECVSIEAAITKYQKLSQIQCGWIYDNDGNVRHLVSPDKNPRLRLMREIIDTELNGKICIAYSHRAVLTMLQEEFKDLNPVWISGGMSSSEVSENKRRFNSDSTCRAILLQDEASKYGHTLLGHDDHICSTMAFFENSYSLDTRGQIEDRIHRHGQTADSVLYLDLVGTKLDKDCVKALQRKEQVFQSVFSKLRSTAGRQAGS